MNRIATTNSLTPDFGRTAADYAQHRAGFPGSFFERLSAFGVGGGEQRVVDLGTGTGTLARGFARRGCHVVGIDPSPAMLEQARLLGESERVAVVYRVASAEATGLPDEYADVVSAGQCWHWFDRPSAALEARRVLKRTGALVIAHLDWLPLRANVVELTERLILTHNPAWRMAGGCGIHPQWLTDVAEAGFTDIESFSYDLVIPYTHEGWRGRIRASAGVSASLPAEAVAVFDAELQALLQQRFPAPNLEVLHRVFAVVSRSPE